jgi:integrase
MAGVLQRNGVWYIKYRDGSGRWRRKATDAKTKTEAKRLADERAREGRRQREGVEPLPGDSRMTLAQLCKWWLEHRCATDRQYLEEKRLQKNVLASDLGATELRHVRAGLVEDQLRRMEKAGAAAKTINGLRGVLHTVYTKARRAGVWSGLNPIDDVESRKVPKKVHPTLKAEEIAVVLSWVPSDWRDLFATALYTALRKGELFGLKRTDVDLKERTLLVARSYDKETTKGKHADLIPIAPPVVPFLEHALETSKSAFVFPAEDGTMRSPDLDPEKILRRALGRAGIVDGYEHICRRCKSKGVEEPSEMHPDDEIRPCPRCRMSMWPKPVPRWMRFHDIRHSTATLLLRAKVPMQHVQRILRHADIKLTVDTYGHLVIDDLRDAIGSLPALERANVIDAESTVTEPAENSAAFGPNLVQAESDPKTTAGVVGKVSATPATSDVGETGFEPATPWSRIGKSSLSTHLHPL